MRPFPSELQGSIKYAAPHSSLKQLRQSFFFEEDLFSCCKKDGPNLSTRLNIFVYYLFQFYNFTMSAVFKQSFDCNCK